MFIDDKDKLSKISKWIIRIAASCILIYLGARYIHVIGNCILWLFDLVLPLIIGIVMALILNIPLHFFENRLFTQYLPIKSKTGKRNLSIFLSLICIIGILILAIFLVVPELVQAIITLVNICSDSIHSFSDFAESFDYSVLPFGAYLQNVNIDWSSLASRLQDFLPSLANNMATKIPAVIGSSMGMIMNLFLGLIFAIYILSQKEKLKSQILRLVHVWIPKNLGNTCIHIANVCSESFRNFIVGQTTEAIILGVLCTIGMLILRLPYASTLGVLVGVTAFLPYIGAYLGGIVGFIMILTINPFKAVVFVIFLVALQQVEGNIIYPKVVGNRINLPSLWVLAALTIGGNLAGPIGMILGVPLFSAAYKLIKEATNKRSSIHC